MLNPECISFNPQFEWYHCIFFFLIFESVFYRFRSNHLTFSTICAMFSTARPQSNQKFKVTKLAESKTRTNIIIYRLESRYCGCWVWNRTVRWSDTPTFIRTILGDGLKWYLWYGLGIDTCDLSNVNIATQATNGKRGNAISIQSRNSAPTALQT